MWPANATACQSFRSSRTEGQCVTAVIMAQSLAQWPELSPDFPLPRYLCSPGRHKRSYFILTISGLMTHTRSTTLAPCENISLSVSPAWAITAGEVCVKSPDVSFPKPTAVFTAGASEPERISANSNRWNIAPQINQRFKIVKRHFSQSGLLADGRVKRKNIHGHMDSFEIMS